MKTRQFNCNLIFIYPIGTFFSDDRNDFRKLFILFYASDYGRCIRVSLYQIIIFFKLIATILHFPSGPHKEIVTQVSFEFRAISRIQENATDTRVFSSEFLPIGLPSMSQSSELNVLSNNGSILPIEMKPNRERPNAAPMLTFTYIIFFLQNLCNPLIYIVSNRAYRTAYYKILWRKSHNPPDGTTLYRSSQHRDAFEMNTQYA